MVFSIKGTDSKLFNNPGMVVFGYVIYIWWILVSNLGIR